MEDSPAERAGLRLGDVIVAAEGESVTTGKAVIASVIGEPGTFVALSGSGGAPWSRSSGCCARGRSAAALHRHGARAAASTAERSSPAPEETPDRVCGCRPYQQRGRWDVFRPRYAAVDSGVRPRRASGAAPRRKQTQAYIRSASSTNGPLAPSRPTHGEGGVVDKEAHGARHNRRPGPGELAASQRQRVRRNGPSTARVVMSPSGREPGRGRPCSRRPASAPRCAGARNQQADRDRDQVTSGGWWLDDEMSPAAFHALATRDRAGDDAGVARATSTPLAMGGVDIRRVAPWETAPKISALAKSPA